MKVATTLALGVAPHAIGKDHPEGVLAGVHSNYYFTYPGGDRWPLNKSFRAALLQALERISELPVGRRLCRALHAQERHRARQQARPAAGRRTRRSSASSRAWAWIRRRAISTSGPTTTRATRTRSPGSARTFRNIRSRPGTPTGSSPFRSATSRRRQLAEARQGPQRVDRGGELDQEDLAESRRLMAPFVL